MSSRSSRPSVAIIGASISGMCAARALSRHCEAITLLEADVLGAAPSMRVRKGVPQAAFPHVLLAGGQAALDQLFPGFSERLRKLGAHEVDLGDEWLRLTDLGWAARRSLNLRLVGATRGLIERAIRELLIEQCSNVRIVDGTRVTALRIEHSPVLRVCGVITESERAPNLTVNADLIVDASGRGSRSLKWLKEHGINSPPEECVKSFVGYSSRLYRAPLRPMQHSSWKGIVVHARYPDSTPFAILGPIEDGLWMVTAGGYNRDFPPRNEAEFSEFFARLRSPVIAEVLREAEPITQVAHTRATNSVWNMAHRWPERPAGFLLFGDALCAPSPVHGQGISKAAFEAQLLLRSLAKHDLRSAQFEQHFINAQAKSAKKMWDVATSLDLRWSNAVGKRAWYLPALHAVQAILLRANDDPHVFATTARVYQLLWPATALLKPSVFARVLRSLVRRTPLRPTEWRAWES